MTNQSQLLIFGEDTNDRQALKNLIKAILPQDLLIDLKPIRSPVILNREAVKSGKRKKMADEIAGFARGIEKAKRRVYVVAHQDCDEVEPAHIDASRALEKELKDAGVSAPIAAVPAWEIETWWMLFPTAVASVRACWRPRMLAA
jgi:hypothetical protein